MKFHKMRQRSLQLNIFKHLHVVQATMEEEGTWAKIPTQWSKCWRCRIYSSSRIMKLLATSCITLWAFCGIWAFWKQMPVLHVRKYYLRVQDPSLTEEEKCIETTSFIFHGCSMICLGKKTVRQWRFALAWCRIQYSPESPLVMCITSGRCMCISSLLLSILGRTVSKWMITPIFSDGWNMRIKRIVTWPFKLWNTVSHIRWMTWFVLLRGCDCFGQNKGTQISSSGSCIW